MINGVFTSLYGLRTSAQKLQNSANNIANVESSGFKKNSGTVSDIKSSGAQLSSITKVNIRGSTLATLSSSLETSHVDIAKEVIMQIKG